MEEQSLFVEFMGDSPMMKILDYLITERELDFSITDMAENAGIGRATLYRIWDSLIKNEIILHTRDIGKAKLFRLNVENTKIKKLIEIYGVLIIEELKNHAETKKIAEQQYLKEEDIIPALVVKEANLSHLYGSLKGKIKMSGQKFKNLARKG